MLSWKSSIQIPNSSKTTGDFFGLSEFNGSLYCAYNMNAQVRLRKFTTQWEQNDVVLPNPTDPYGISNSPALQVFNGSLHLVHQGSNGSGWAWMGTSADGTNWTSDKLIPDPQNAFGLSESPALAVYNGALYIAHKGRGNSSDLWYSSYMTGIGWIADNLVQDSTGNTYGLSLSPGLATLDKLYCVRKDKHDHSLWWGTFDGSWSSDTQDQTIHLYSAPSLAVVGNKIYCAYIGDTSGHIFISSLTRGTQAWVSENAPNVSVDRGGVSIAAWNGGLMAVYQKNNVIYSMVASIS